LLAVIEAKARKQGARNDVGEDEGVDGNDLLHSDKGELDEIRVEEQKAYRNRLSKWCRESLELIKDPLFWELTRICLLLQGPADHLMNFTRSLAESSACQVARLATGKAAEIQKEFTNMLFDDSFAALFSCWIEGGSWLPDFSVSLVSVLPV
jgi:hypothetical protein